MYTESLIEKTHRSEGRLFHVVNETTEKNSRLPMLKLMSINHKYSKLSEQLA